MKSKSLKLKRPPCHSKCYETYGGSEGGVNEGCPIYKGIVDEMKKDNQPVPDTLMQNSRKIMFSNDHNTDGLVIYMQNVLDCGCCHEVLVGSGYVSQGETFDGFDGEKSLIKILYDAMRRGAYKMKKTYEDVDAGIRMGMRKGL